MSGCFLFVLDLPLSISITLFTLAVRRCTSPRPRHARARCRASRYDFSQTPSLSLCGFVTGKSTSICTCFPFLSLIIHLTRRVLVLTCKNHPPTSLEAGNSSPILPFSHFACHLSLDLTITQVAGPSFTLLASHSIRLLLATQPRLFSV